MLPQGLTLILILILALVLTLVLTLTRRRNCYLKVCGCRSPESPRAQRLPNRPRHANSVR